MSTAYRWIERTVYELERQGWRVRRDGSHVIVYPADKNKAAFALSGTPGDRNTVKNTIARLRKAGADVSRIPLQ